MKVAVNWEVAPSPNGGCQGGDAECKASIACDARAEECGSVDSPAMIGISNAPVDLFGEVDGPAIGSKQSSRFQQRIGGNGPNGARAAIAEGMSAGVVCIQGVLWVPVIRQMMEAEFIRPYIISRHGDGAALSVSVASGKGGARTLYVQRLQPNLRRTELTTEIVAALQGAQMVTVGPMANVDDETIELVRFVGQVANFSVLVPHRDLIGHPQFAETAGVFSLVVVNDQEAGLLAPATDDPVKHALRMRHTIGEEVELVVTNGPEPGLIWAAGHWFWYNPPAVKVVNDVGAGDVFSTVFAIWRLRGAHPSEAARRAMAAAADWISGIPMGTGVSRQGPSPFCGHSGVDLARVSWGEQAI